MESGLRAVSYTHLGMATNIPPHNLGETIDAVKLMMDNPEVTTRELMEVLPGPDFPTGALVMGKSGIHKAYETGKGSIVLRSRTEIEVTKSGRERIVVTEFPYMVNKKMCIRDRRNPCWIYQTDLTSFFQCINTGRSR